MTDDTTTATPTEPQTLGDWFARLDPAPPVALAAELRRLLADDAHRPVTELPEVCLATGERLLQELMHSGSTSRGTALTLLAVDALVTYAFQAGSAEPLRLEERAATAMQRIAQLAEQ